MRHLVTATTGIVGTIALAALAACSDPSAPQRAVPDGARFANGPDPKITICHAAGRAGTTKYVTITMSSNGQNGHITERGTPEAGHEQDFIYVAGMPTCESFGGGTASTWTLDKNYLGAFAKNPDGSMFLVSGPTAVASIPSGSTLWLEFEIVATAPSSSATASLTDLASLACASLPPGFLCQALPPYGDAANNDLLVNYTRSITGSYTTTFFIDVTNTSACGTGGIITNVATLTPTGEGMLSDAASAQIVAPACN
jgi:hypothetical protein